MIKKLIFNLFFSNKDKKIIKSSLLYSARVYLKRNDLEAFSNVVEVLGKKSKYLNENDLKSSKLDSDNHFRSTVNIIQNFKIPVEIPSFEVCEKCEEKESCVFYLFQKKARAKKYAEDDGVKYDNGENN